MTPEMIAAFGRLGDAAREAARRFGKLLWPMLHPNEAWLDRELAKVLDP